MISEDVAAVLMGKVSCPECRNRHRPDCWFCGGEKWVWRNDRYCWREEMLAILQEKKKAQPAKATPS